ncbi:hypothetical protein H072_7628 [Dactylellina haptotyla CBS 200.50]|uniref:GST N-terminal domain-containing protein n=1 Tax=Dactylellina haptotyla (strain CBS 200.50) TaxID=1284197 RepID=S8AC07_DACHA|nr:hypothetical protein H072_7628 [Dactylellina haptotyla CBS 200.50]
MRYIIPRGSPHSALYTSTIEYSSLPVFNLFCMKAAHWLPRRLALPTAFHTAFRTAAAGTRSLATQTRPAVKRNTLIPTTSLRHRQFSRPITSSPAMSSQLYTDETPEPGLHLITQSTPNGQKVQILLEELKEVYGTQWTTSIINIGTNEQKKEWFLRLNPNGRIPVIVDNDQSPPFPVMETSAELLYLIEREDKDNIFGFTDSFERNQMLQWLFFWHGSGAPYQGQVNHFFKFAQEQIEYPKQRFKNETLRVYGVLEIHLSGKFSGQPREYLAGKGTGKYSVADIGTWTWVRGWAFPGAFSDEEMQAFPHLLQWIDRIAARPAVQKGTGDDYNAAKRPELYVGEKK